MQKRLVQQTCFVVGKFITIQHIYFVFVCKFVNTRHYSVFQADIPEPKWTALVFTVEIILFLLFIY